MKFEEIKLRGILGNYLVSLFKECNVIIAGGAITSIFCNRDIADIDIYVKDEESLKTLITELLDENYFVQCHTKKATLFIKDGVQVQVIHIGYFETPQDVFANFDFTVCMGAYDFTIEKFTLHNDFLKHNAQRVLEFNGDTKFPLMSALRIQKYKDKGYKISKAEYMKVILACMDTKITSYSELKEHLGGMYGLDMSKVFDETKEFSLSSAMKQLSNLYVHDDYYKHPESILWENADDIIDNILGKAWKYFVSNGSKYIIKGSGRVLRVCEVPNDATEITAKEYFAEHRLFKYVQKRSDGLLRSHYDQSFEYNIGSIAIAKSSCGLYCGLDRDNLMYGGELIELGIVDNDDIIEISENTAQLRKAMVIQRITED